MKNTNNTINIYPEATDTIITITATLQDLYSNPMYTEFFDNKDIEDLNDVNADLKAVLNRINNRIAAIY